MSAEEATVVTVDWLGGADGDDGDDVYLDWVEWTIQSDPDLRERIVQEAYRRAGVGWMVD